MKWSFQIGSAFGIPIRLHLTFLLLLFFLVVKFRPDGVFVDVGGAILVVLLFGCVLLHELAHSVTAMRRGIRVHSITLLPIGGVAQMATMPENPSEEVQIALAGPMMSYCVAAVIFIIGGVLGRTHDVLRFPTAAQAGLLSHLFWANVMLGTLNLMPAFPMDGGRVLRGLLALRIGMVRATRVAVSLGHVLAVIIYCIGALYYQQLGYSLILLAVFIYLGAGNEEEDVQFRSEIADVPARAAMLITFDSLPPTMTIHDSLEVLRHSQQEEFPVLAAGKLAGMVSKNAVLGALSELPGEAVIGEIMRQDYVPCAPDTPLGRIFRQMEERDKDVVPILEDGKLVGLLSYDQIGRYHSLSAKKREAEKISTKTGDCA